MLHLVGGRDMLGAIGSVLLVLIIAGALSFGMCFGYFQDPNSILIASIVTVVIYSLVSWSRAKYYTYKFIESTAAERDISTPGDFAFMLVSFAILLVIWPLIAFIRALVALYKGLVALIKAKWLAESIEYIGIRFALWLSVPDEKFDRPTLVKIGQLLEQRAEKARNKRARLISADPSLDRPIDQ